MKRENLKKAAEIQQEIEALLTSTYLIIHPHPERHSDLPEVFVSAVEESALDRLTIDYIANVRALKETELLSLMKETEAEA